MLFCWYFLRKRFFSLRSLFKALKEQVAVSRQGGLKNMPAYFHVSIRANRESIRKIGVDPIFSRGAMQVSWWVAEGLLEWAIAHVMKRYKAEREQIDVWVCFRRLRGSRPWSGKKGVYLTFCMNRPDALHNFLD